MAKKSFFEAAKWYDPLFENVLRGLRMAVVELVPPREGLRVLDVGCGTGAQLAIYKEGGGEVFGIDLSSPMLSIARSKLNGSSVLANGNAISMPFPDHCFDLVLSSLFLHQINPSLRPAVLSEMVRVLQPGGQLILIDFHPQDSRPLKGKLTYGLISAIEFLAGWDHYNNSRDFLTRGGVSSLAGVVGLKICRSAVKGNGNLGIYLIGWA